VTRAPLSDHRRPTPQPVRPLRSDLRRRSADLATIRRMAERADALAAFLELARRPAEAIAAANIAAGLRQAIP
jgi:hypothetical protein